MGRPAIGPDEGNSMAHAATERPVVLIVEDEFLMRMYAADMIKQF